MLFTHKFQAVFLSLTCLGAIYGMGADVLLFKDGQARVVIVAPAEVIEGKGAATAAASTYYACGAAGQRRILQASIQDLSVYLEKIGGAKVPTWQCSCAACARRANHPLSSTSAHRQRSPARAPWRRRR